MFSLSRLLGHKDSVLELLQARAEAARDAAHAVHQLAQGNVEPAQCLATLSAARHREKVLAAQVSEALVARFVMALDREDIEAINAALYPIPKTVEKFAARHLRVAGRLQGLDFSPRTALLAACTEVVVTMVRELCAGLRIEPMRKLHARLQALEAEADQLLLEPCGGLYLHERDAIRVLLANDLFETIEKSIDACCDVGNVIYVIVLKNS